MTKSQAVAARELRGLGLAALELVDHLALGDCQVANREGETELFGREAQLHRAKADFADQRVGF